MNRYHHIVVGIDFSAACLSAYATAVRLASRHGTPVTAVHVVDPKLVGILKEAHQASEEEALKHVLQSVRTYLSKADAETELVDGGVEVGHPFLSLVAVCKGHGADLLVVGTRDTWSGPQ